jgi:hypothetical protein
VRGRALRIPRDSVVSFRLQRPLEMGVADRDLMQDGLAARTSAATLMLPAPSGDFIFAEKSSEPIQGSELLRVAAFYIYWAVSAHGAGSNLSVIFG